MINGLYSATSGMDVDMHKMDVISNNMANVDTPGYKKGIIVQKSFAEGLNERINNLPDNKGTYVDEVVTDFSRGDSEFTGRKLDFYIGAEGFFAVNTPRGLAYTRNGSFHVNPQGYLATSSGNYVMGENGPINLSGYSDIKVTEEGNILGDGMPVDRLVIADFQKPYRMTRRAGSTFVSQQQEMPAIVERPMIKQNYLESSNVSSVGIVNEMVSMIKTFRHYEACQRVVTMQDQVLDKAVNEIARV